MLLSPLYDKPNRILEKQKIIQNDHRPIMRRLPRSQLYLGLYGAGYCVSMFATAYGLWALVKGKPATEAK
ncbi:hypothetical protein L208DRAFT_1399024 [Tricholoma matsutake]|nr:hypothetical protein L208DRAFT_1399024 [Tricholoma matsutake 945]